MRYYLLFLVLFASLFFSQLASSQEANVQFEQANQLYRSGDYQKASQSYEQIVSTGIENTFLYYNLGNSYYKLKEYPSAILNYERAKRLTPNDEEIEHNLHLANLRVVDKIEPVPQLFILEWWKMFVNLFSSDGWGWLAISFLWGSALCGILLLLLRIDILRRVLLLLSTLTLFLSILGFVGMAQRHSIENEQYAIVFAQSVSIKSAPDAQSTDLFVIHEGVKAQILDTVGEWKKIKLLDGKIGWMQVSGLQII